MDFGLFPGVAAMLLAVVAFTTLATGFATGFVALTFTALLFAFDVLAVVDFFATGRALLFDVVRLPLTDEREVERPRRA